jgi:uncharacterized protein (DUF433 family)
MPGKSESRPSPGGFFCAPVHRRRQDGNRKKQLTVRISDATFAPLREVNHMTWLNKQITVDPAQCGGRPCIRGMRIRVSDVLDLFANGLSAGQILDEMPDLKIEDLTACLQYASRRIDHPVVAA